MTPSTPPGDWEVAEARQLAAEWFVWRGKDSTADRPAAVMPEHIIALDAEIERLREREKIQAGKLSAAIRRAEAAEAHEEELKEAITAYLHAGLVSQRGILRHALQGGGMRTPTEIERDSLAAALFKAEARVAELEEALREITQLSPFNSPVSAGSIHRSRQIARRALGEE